MVFAVFVGFVVSLRVAELLLSRSNKRWLLRHGAVEYGEGHYPYLVLLHTLFFISLIAEHALTGPRPFSLVLLLLYFAVLAFKAWAIFSLGRCWNTKIYRLPACPLVRRGPYRWMKHPNYLAVAAEIALIPLIFHLWVTAVVFSLLDAVVLCVRIREENKALML